MADFPIYCHIRYDAEPNKNGKLKIACTDVSDHDFRADLFDRLTS